ncbi:hypothetical protein LQ954_09500 [Sphingomonas sp. IC-11]|uniref:surface-adhesin E family protein n=1 Tax=Sphingomonas sp. IC-11 TaxID=2898528 RepID=UPI001E39BDF8|nr:surface-adhesin E family protein [Sphingomonas sp. IC-11]MCD2316383.1 hypothetical protein [Sphingomonas sp. IC-11]
MMFRFALAVLLAGAAATAASARDIYMVDFNEHSDGSYVVFVDKDTVVKSTPTNARMWSHIGTLENGSVNIETSFIQYDCSEKSYRFLQSGIYDRVGRFIKSAPPTPKQFIAPNTISEILWYVACSGSVPAASFRLGDKSVYEGAGQALNAITNR